MIRGTHQLVKVSLTNKLERGLRPPDHRTKSDINKECEMEDLFKEHNVALLCVSLVSLVFGLPLASNVLWHLKAGLSNDKVISFLPILTCII